MMNSFIGGLVIELVGRSLAVVATDGVMATLGYSLTMSRHGVDVFTRNPGMYIESKETMPRKAERSQMPASDFIIHNPVPSPLQIFSSY
ncbi:hypothetical protein BKA67DRAFT_580861 [Truncatella angustata]|uniref:Uncharacterized protein n=1 Tax=Truncatella angustata TaxID=152316 RepID=A0A9P8RPD7_9PEZI|nr:uncharacterized protein BKA67DRAFT_580861 [Truncatella angustata]KAH6646900.1 hypothetical protein BKA67DRAFT_580861 [Truncatella angustata]